MAEEYIEQLGIQFKVLASTSPVVWNKLSFWSRAVDTQFADGKTAEEKVGNINGITNSATSVNKNLVPSSYIFSNLAGEAHQTGNKNIVTLNAAGWSSSTTTVGGVNYYTYEVTATNILVAHPLMFLNANSMPSKDVLKIWDNLHAVANTSNKKITFYNKYKPTVNVSVGLKGVIFPD